MSTRVRPDLPDCPSQADTPPDDTTLQGAYERHRDRVFDLCYHYLGQVADAEDAVHETFARAARRLPGLTGDRGAYLLAVARNLCCNELRRRRRVVPVETIDREDRAVEAERGIVERAVLERLWVRLSPRERSLIHDTYAGFSQQEIAGRIGLSPNAVAVALLRARQRARTYASRALAGFLPLALAWRWAQRAARRVANTPAEATAAIGLQIQQVGMVLTAALVGALATTAPAGGAVAGLAGARSAGVGAGTGAVAEAATPVGATPGAVGGSVARAQTPGGSSSGPISPMSVLDPLVNPGRNAPQQDVGFNSVTPSPNYSSDHTVFASGYLLVGCPAVNGCPVLYKSTDGGASWTNMNAQGFSGGRLLLPPAWPRDPVMFAMGTTGLQKSAPDGSFHLVVPVNAPASITPDSTPGNERVLIAGNPVLIYAAATNTLSQGPLLPPGLEPPSDVAFVDDARHIELTAIDASSTNPATGSESTSVVQCVAASCAVVAHSAGVAPLNLAVSPVAAADHTVVAFHGSTVLESVDGGHSFSTSTAPVPANGRTVASFGPSGARGGLVLAGFGSSPIVVQLPPGSAAKSMPSSGLPSTTPIAALVELADGRLVAAITSSTDGHLGLLCLLPTRAAWTASC